jgi:hypothetical protein
MNGPIGRSWRCRAPAVLAGAILAVVPLGTGAGADPTFVSGSGRARASLFEIVPRTGGLEIPINFGKALTTYQGLSATATSGGVKPPSQKSGDGDCGGGLQPPGGGGNSNPTSFPFVSILSVSTGEKDAEKGRQVDQGNFPDGSPVSGRFEHQEVAATADPSARAATTTGQFGFGKLVEVVNARTESQAGVVGGKARLAHAVTIIDRLNLLDGLVTLVDVRWEATQQTGEEPRADGGFTVGSVLFQGKPLPAPPAPPNLPGGSPAPPTLPDPLAALDTALGPTGLVLEAPHVDTAGGVVRVSPMSLRIADSALGRVVLGPIVAGLQPLRDPVVGGLLALSCDFGTAVTVADLATGVLTGSGGISFDVGGVTATTEGEAYDNPFAGGIGDGGDLGGGGFGSDDVPGLPERGGDSTAAPTASLGDHGAGTGTGSSPDLGLSGGGFNTSPGSANGTGSGSAVGSAAAGDEVAYADPSGVFTPASRHLPGHTGGRALAVAALALLTVAALAAADAFHVRRASRSIS